MDALVHGRLTRVAAVAGIVGILGAAALAGSRADAAVSQVATLTVNFNQDGSISVALGDGTPVGTPGPPGTLIPAGTYQIVVNNPFRDDSDVVHKFDLAGPGVELVTDMNEGEEQQDSWTELFRPSSTYTYQDDYAPGIHGIFRTSATSATSSGASSPGSGAGGSSAGTVSNTPSAPAAKTSGAGTVIQSAALRGTLLAVVTKAGAVKLTEAGKAVATLRPGRYKLSVTDSSASSGFTIQASRKPATTLTAPSFVGKRTATLQLAPGRWFFYSSPGGGKTPFVVSG